MRDAIVITGATATGKTDLSLILAERLGAEIVSVDSRLVYRGLDIGTAKPTRDELARVPHHLVDVADPGERFTVSDFIRLCGRAVEDIASRGKIPILAGGTCMYLTAMFKGWNFADLDIDEEIRRGLEKRLTDEGAAKLHEELQAVDMVSANRIHPNDARRIVRALEVYHSTGMKMSDRGKEGENSLLDDYNVVTVGVCRERKILHDRINKRAFWLYNNGLIEEAGRVLDAYPGCESFLTQVIGYADALDVIQGKASEAEAITATAAATRAFARRQIIWLRRMRSIMWLDLDATTAKQGVELIESALTK